MGVFRLSPPKSDTFPSSYAKHLTATGPTPSGPRHRLIQGVSANAHIYIDMYICIYKYTYKYICVVKLEKHWTFPVISMIFRTTPAQVRGYGNSWKSWEISKVFYDLSNTSEISNDFHDFLDFSQILSLSILVSHTGALKLYSLKLCPRESLTVYMPKRMKGCSSFAWCCTLSRLSNWGF